MINKDLRGEEAGENEEESNTRAAAQMHPSVGSHTYQKQSMQSAGLFDWQGLHWH